MCQAECKVLLCHFFFNLILHLEDSHYKPIMYVEKPESHKKQTGPRFSLYEQKVGDLCCMLELTSSVKARGDKYFRFCRSHNFRHNRSTLPCRGRQT